MHFTTISYGWSCQVTVQLFCFAVPEGCWVSACSLPHAVASRSFLLLLSSKTTGCPFVTHSPVQLPWQQPGAWEKRQDQALKLPDLAWEIINLHAFLSVLHLQIWPSWAIKQERALSSFERKKFLWQLLPQRLLGSVRFPNLQFSMFPVYLYYFRNPFPSGY